MKLGFWVFALYFCLAKGMTKRASEGYCDSNTLTDYTHLHLFDGITRLKEYPPMRSEIGYEFCGKGESCCSKNTLLNLKTQFLYFDNIIEGAEMVTQNLILHPSDSIVALEKLVPFFSLDKEIILSPEMIKSLTNLEHLEEDENFVGMLSSGFQVFRALVGYQGAFACSVCDPTSKKYLNGNTLIVKDNACSSLSNHFVEFLDSFATFISSSVVKSKIGDVLINYCQMADVYNLDCSRSTVLKQLEDFLNIFIKNDNIFKAVCGPNGKKDCEEQLCINTFKGLAVDVTSVNATVINFIQKSCPSFVKQHCDVWTKTLINYHPNINAREPGGFPVMKLVKASDKGEDASRALDVIDYLRKTFITRIGFSHSDFGSGLHHKAHHLHHHHGGFFHFLWKFIKFIFICGILGAGGYYGWLYYKKRQEERGEYYSVLSESRI